MLIARHRTTVPRRRKSIHDALIVDTKAFMSYLQTITMPLPCHARNQQKCCKPWFEDDWAGLESRAPSPALCHRARRVRLSPRD